MPLPAESFGPTSVTAMSPMTMTRSKPEVTARQTEAKSKPESHIEPPAAQASSNEAAPRPVEHAPDPAIAGESDLDPFAEEEGVTFSPGGTEARRGREVKLKRPRIDLGFMAEATRLSGRDLAIRMSIATDGVGHPSRVVVLDSSGSDLIDDAVRLAMYDSWFGGKMPDNFAFTVRFVRR